PIVLATADGDWDEADEAAEMLAAVESSRFVGERQARYHAREFFMPSGIFHNIHEDEFRAKFRTTRDCFAALCERIEDHPIFTNESTCQQIRIEYQVAVALNRLGTNGNAAGVTQLSTNAENDHQPRRQRLGLGRR
ncbi:hypothetical protein DFS34DRAFT_583498, partial [Phlyctochytrium arcticum]